MDVQAFIEQQALWLLISSAAIYLLLRHLFRRFVTGGADPFNFYLIYISLGMCLIPFAIASGNANLFVLSSGVLLFLVTYSFGIKEYRWGNLSIGFSLGQPREQAERGPLLVALAVALAVYLQYMAVILSSGFLSNLSATAVGDRYQLSSANRLAFYLFSAAQFLPPVLIHALSKAMGTDFKWRWAMVVLAFCWLVQLLTFSKTAMLFPVLSYAIVLALRRYDGLSSKQTFRRQVLALGAVGLGVFAVVAGISIAAGGVELFMSVLMSVGLRLFTSFDGLVMLSTTDLSALPNLSIVQFYLAPVLKILGLYTQEYNATNFFIATEILGMDPDTVGLLPNNNLVAEMYLCFPAGLRWSVIAFAGFFHGSLFRFFYRRRAGSLYGTCVFGLLISNPFGMLIDGQGWFGTLIALHVILVVVWVLLVLLGRSGKVFVNAGKTAAAH